jgi:His/Glu/Gln/Arg/opine family amino acid ABC transporter permease subunit
MSTKNIPAAAARNVAFVRAADAPKLRPPASETGVIGWIWRNVLQSMSQFSSPAAAVQSIIMIILTVLIAYSGLAMVWGLIKFGLIDAVWLAPEGVKREACTTVLQGGALPADWFGSCYPYISAKWKLFVYGRYPEEEIWRVNLVFLLGSLGIAWLVAESIPYRRINGVVLTVLGVGYGLLVMAPDLYGEQFGVRVGVQILIGVGLIYALAPSEPPKRTVGILMLTVYPLLSFILLTGADLAVGTGFWLWFGTAAIILGTYAIIANLGVLGAVGRAFCGIAGAVAVVLVVILAIAFASSSRFVDVVESSAGNTLNNREKQAIQWWRANKVIDAPILQSAIERLNIRAWSRDEIKALSLSIREDSGGLWNKDAAMATVERFDPELTSAERFDLERTISALAAAGPSARQATKFALDTGITLEGRELARLSRLNWSESFLDVASAPGKRDIWPFPTVETDLWGGLLITLVVAIVGIVFSLPLGILLALGRRSSLPAVRILSIVFIEFWRGVPLITVLFMSSVMLPLFLPEGTDFNKLMRALIGVMLFSAAYQAEVVRGGLQAIPKGQFEAADAVGLTYWQSMGLIVLPQALTLVIPGIVNTFIGLFKDTALVSIISLFDLLGIVQSSFSDASWASPVQLSTGFFVMCLIYFLFCFGMSRYSMYMERKLRKGHAR